MTKLRWYDWIWFPLIWFGDTFFGCIGWVLDFIDESMDRVVDYRRERKLKK